MSIYEKIDNARKLLGLGENATIKEIKEAYKNLCLKYHPDRCEEKDKKKYEEMIRKLNESMEILLNYCVNYNISFKKEAFCRAFIMDSFNAFISSATSESPLLIIYPFAPSPRTDS